VRPDRLRGSALAGLAGAIVVLYYCFFTWRSVGLYFDQDDMMNLYFAWTQPLTELLTNIVLYWRDPLRPLGAGFYRSVFAAAGFHPLPFRLACLALGLLNLALCCRLVKLLSGSAQTVAFAAILFAFHTRLMEVWFRTAVIYDLLCFTFFVGGACLYLAPRVKGEYPGVARSFAIIVFFIAAMDAKEVAVALPAVLLVWELLFSKLRWRNVALPVLLGLLTLPYILAKTIGPKALTGNPFYQPEYSLARFTETWGTFLGFLYVRPAPLSAVWVWTLLAVPLLVAVAVRSRVLLFAWGWAVLATLPMSFLPYRGGFVLYISYAGWVLYAGWTCSKLVDAATRRQPRWKPALAALTFVVLGWRMGKLNLHDQRADNREWLYGPPRMIRLLAEEIKTPDHARLLFEQDAFGTDEWTPVFIVRLIHRDANLVVDRVKMMNGKPASRNDYDFVFTYARGHYQRLKP
jgi:hypothetical protein